MERPILGGEARKTDVAADLPHFIDNVYDTTRLHSALGYLSSVQFEERNAPPRSNQAAYGVQGKGRTALPAVIDWVLEPNDCTATETEIFEAVESRTDLWTANQAIGFWTESDGFDMNYTYRRKGETGIYTMTSGEVCGNRAPEDPGDLSRAGEWPVSQTISAECAPADGRFAPEDIHRRDLDGDEQIDLVSDHAGVTCNSGMPMSCGAQVCTSEILLRRRSLLQKAAKYHAGIAGIGHGDRPAIRLYPNGGAEYEVVWSGSGFSQR